MNGPHSHCPHITTVGDHTKEDIIRKQQLSKCDLCENRGPNLWICLHRDCLFVGCGKPYGEHSHRHFQERNEHSLFLNLTSLRVWCSLCEREVFLENNDPPLAGMLPPHHMTNKMNVPDTDSDEDEMGAENVKPRGLTGLQNLGNTCYMNSAIQALSNCPQLTNFFLECGSFVRSEKKPGLAKSYMRLVKEMWHKRRPSYVVPSGIAYGIKMLFPVFRGYTQQDAQEFLRCFMDQLHEELKEPMVEVINCNSVSPDMQEDFDSCRGESAGGGSEESSQSEAEYETCDSGLSSEKSSCADECGDSMELFPAERDENHTCVLPCSRCTPQQAYAGNMQRDSSQVKSNSSQLQSPVVERSGLGVHGDGASDSGVPGNHSADLSESESVIDPKSPVELRRSEKFEFTKCNRGSYSCRPGVAQTQRKNVPPHTLINPMHIPKKRKPQKCRSIISDVFDGKILSSVQCLTCDTISTTKETFQDLSLPIPNRDHLHLIHASHNNQQKAGSTCTDVYSHQGWISWFFGWMISWFWGPAVGLHDCLAAFFSADELKGDNMYSCEKCKKLRNGIKYSKVMELPEVLCIHLKRFRHEVMFSSKISSYVSFPLEGLDMAPFLHKAYPQGVTTYDLAAVICHHGTAGSGHYTTYALNYLNDQWYEFDDQYVTAVDPQTVQNCEAYVLFYRKSPEEMIKKRQRAVELLERSKNEPGLLQFHISKQWVNRFNTFAEPGPITNTDFLCAHGGVPPDRAPCVEELCTVLSQAVWEYLHDTFGGGPSCTHLYICPICQAEQESLDRRRRQEYDTFISLNNEFVSQENPPIVYAFSINWFKQWESFVKGKENDPPGPVDNSTICYLKGNQAVLKMGSDYGSLSEKMWRFFISIYGGGPEIVIQQNISSISTPACSQVVATHPCNNSSNMSRSAPVSSCQSSFLYPNARDISSQSQVPQVHISSIAAASDQTNRMSCEKDPSPTSSASTVAEGE